MKRSDRTRRREAQHAPAMPVARRGPRLPHAPAGALLALILAAATWLQRAGLGAPFFADDYLFLDQVRGRSLPATLASPDPIGNFLRPVGRQLHFWWLAHASGESPRVFHVANLVLFLASVALLFTLIRRLAGVRAASIAATILALHYAADVPLAWASGSQDLLALVLALAAIVLHLAGRRFVAAISFLLAILSKETVLFTPLIAVLLDRNIERSWSRRALRAWPLAASGAVWAVLWIVTSRLHPAAGAALAFHPSGLPAALFHLVQVALGLEWRTGGGPAFISVLPPIVPIVIVMAAVTWAWGTHSPSVAGARGRTASVPHPGSAPLGLVTTGLMWAALGALPVTLVAPIWSAYYFLFALCGVAVALGAALARRSRVVALLVVAVLAWSSDGGRALEEFATASGPWTPQSHVNRFYLTRSMRFVTRFLEDLRSARPTLPRSSTVFYLGVPPSVGWQTADGPLLRWAYRDSSLRSYFLTEFSAQRAQRGPTFFFRCAADSLIEEWRDKRPYSDISLAMMLEDRVTIAREASIMDLAGNGADLQIPYRLAWLEWARGDTVEALSLLRRSGVATDRGPTPEALDAGRVVAAGGDTMRAALMLQKGVERHALDAEAHAMLADLLLSRPIPSLNGFIEAFAARVLMPDNPSAWRRWTTVQLLTRRHRQALASLERYFTLGGEAARNDPEARSWEVTLKRILPGGDIAQRGLSDVSRGGP